MYDDSRSIFEELAASDNETWRSIAATKAKPAAEPALTATSSNNIVSQTDGNANEELAQNEEMRHASAIRMMESWSECARIPHFRIFNF